MKNILARSEVIERPVKYIMQLIDRISYCLSGNNLYVRLHLPDNAAYILSSEYLSFVDTWQDNSRLSSRYSSDIIANMLITNLPIIIAGGDYSIGESWNSSGIYSASDGAALIAGNISDNIRAVFILGFNPGTVIIYAGSISTIIYYSVINSGYSTCIIWACYTSSDFTFFDNSRALVECGNATDCIFSVNGSLEGAVLYRTVIAPYDSSYTFLFIQCRNIPLDIQAVNDAILLNIAEYRCDIALPCKINAGYGMTVSIKFPGKNRNHDKLTPCKIKVISKHNLLVHRPWIYVAVSCKLKEIIDCWYVHRLYPSLCTALLNISVLLTRTALLLHIIRIHRINVRLTNIYRNECSGKST